jgi:hypothetical protein
MVGKAQLCALSEKDVESRSLVNRIQNPSSSVFLALLDILLIQSDLRQSNIRIKRQKVRQTSENKQTLESKQTSEISIDLDISQTAHLSFGMHFVTKLIVDNFPALQTHEHPPSTHSTPGLSVAPALNTTTITPVKVKSKRGKSKRQSKPRVVSNASVANPIQDSAGGARVWASYAKASDMFANILIRHVISSIWPDGITLDWVEGRKGDTELVWSSKYIPSPDRHVTPSLLPPLYFSRFPTSYQHVQS